MVTDIMTIKELRTENEALKTQIEWYQQRIPFVLAEEGFNSDEIDDIQERLTPPENKL